MEQPTKESIIKAYNIAKEAGADSTCKVLEALYPNVDFTAKDNRPVTERVTSFLEALRELGDNHPLVRSYLKLVRDRDIDKTDRNLIAFLKLRIICAALNEGWEPQFSEDECRWYPWFVLCSADELAEKSDEWKAARTIVPLDNYRVVGRSNCNSNASGGLAFAYASHASSYSGTLYGSRLAFKTEELANYAARQFTELWADFYLIRK